MKRPSGFYRTSQAFQSGVNQAGRSTAVAGSPGAATRRSENGSVSS